MGINIHRRGEKGDTPDYQVTQWINIHRGEEKGDTPNYQVTP
jgi:hypothetical protein